MEAKSQPTTRTLEEIETELTAHEERVAKEAVQNAETSKRLRAERRAVVHRDYFIKYKEWDWIVRKRYMDLVTSLAYKYPYPPHARGYTFELFNYTPRLPHAVMNSDYQLASPEWMISYDPRCLELNTLTEFVPPENIDQCKLTPKIVDAFLLLKYLAPDDTMARRGFGISRQEEIWRDPFTVPRHVRQSGLDFDYDGYKFHLVTPSDHEASNRDSDNNK